jgi:SAM-dependent methyltransferase
VDQSSANAYSGVENLEVMREARKYNAFLLSLITRRLSPGDKVVDFGAGCGTLALPLLQSGVDIVCVEPDPTLNACLRQSGLPARTGIEEILDKSVDLIYTFNVLEHIAEDAATLRELADKLKPGGTLVIYVPAFDLLFSAMDRKVGHLRRYRRAQLVALLGAARLRVLEARYVDSLGFAAALIYRALGSESGELDRRAVKFYDRVAFPISRALDLLLSRWLGKNLLAVAAKA